MQKKKHVNIWKKHTKEQTTVQKFFKKRNKYFLFSKDALNWSKVTVKTFIMLQKISISNKYSSLLIISTSKLK